MTPRVTTVDVTVDADLKEFCITPLSDLHIESRDFGNDEFQAFLRKRNTLPGHRAFIIGDAMDLVVPVDMKRWTASCQDQRISGRDDWLNEALDIATERLTESGTQIDLIGPGNHELEFRKRHGFDTTSVLAHSLGCARGGYSGYMQYRVKLPIGKKTATVGMFRIAYHHGAWGGRLVKGFGGARDWFRCFDSWNIAVYGHNHQSTVHRETKLRPAQNGSLCEYPVYYVCCGAWVESYTQDAARTHYSERAGHMPTSRQSPLIRVRVTNHGGGHTKTLRGQQLQYTVEM